MGPQRWSNDIPLHPSPSSTPGPLDQHTPVASSSRHQSPHMPSSAGQLYHDDSYHASSPYDHGHSQQVSQWDDSEDEGAFDPFSIDPNYRLRTVRTAHSVIAESIRSEHDAERRKRKRRLFSSLKSRKMSTVREGRSKSKRGSEGGTSSTAVSELGSSTPRKTSVIRTRSAPPSPEKHKPEEPKEKDKGKRKGKAPLPRRTVYINLPLPSHLLNTKGEPLVRYVRNKVRTSKYTLVTFIPKNLFEQFRRVANIYFLALVVLQVFPIFGATNAQIGMLPLLAILGMTAIKDGVEDWRRATLDDEVNNSATTKLGGWRNVNQPHDSRTLLERMFGAGQAPDKPSRGVKKLRAREAEAGHEIVMERQKALDEEEYGDVETIRTPNHPLATTDSRTSLTSDRSNDYGSGMLRKRSSAPSMMSRKSNGVMDWGQIGKGTARWERTLWKKLEVGDLVLLRDNEQVPADIIVLSTSNADSLAFVETKNLDGETNLKVRKALKATAEMDSEEDLEHAHFMIDSEPPHANLYTYNGVLRYLPTGEGKGGEERQEAITINELLLRGCTLRNTKWIIGMVVFTGADTKIMLNGGDTPSKRSKIEKETNFNVIMNFLILIVLCLLTAILHGWYRSLDGTSAQSYEIGAEAAENIYLDSVIIFASCLIVFQNIVPISLYITIEIVKTIQAYFIFQDIEMYYAPYDTPCVPKTWNISDDLGQIEYVFSDKTGTLTQNVMEFKKCSIQGVTFGEGLTEAMMGAAKRDGIDLSSQMASQDEELAIMKDQMVSEMSASINNRYFQEDKLTLIAPNLPRHLRNLADPLRPHIIEFFRALAICHSVLADTPEPKKPFELEYKAESPDEAALVAAARDVGFPFVNSNNKRIDIEVLGRKEKWVPLRVLEFNSTRKRMSVIVRDPQGRIVLFCKGADSVIYERLAKDHDANLKAATLKDLETFANGGLRTLCISHRYLDEAEYESWAKLYDDACAAVVDRETEIEKACELVEHSLTILGATALEDKLQEGVPDAIAMLHRAGIKLWILTGDKLQTAIEIGYSCNLLTNDMEVMIISADSEEGARAQIEAGLNKIASVVGPPVVNKHARRGDLPGGHGQATFAVVIDGDSLRYALQPGLKSLFLTLGTQCSAVICCRVSPSQKALTVKLVKEGCNAMTLSIGDGANDVAMIQEANVGVGLYGLEGSQAAMSADYAFGQFRFLTRLLLVHGRWSYVRIADMHANFFYKNIIWTISMFWFLIFNSFDATYLFEYTLMLLYNLVFTSLPVGMQGSFDQDTNARASLAFPQLYKRGIQGLDYTRKRFWLYMSDGLYQSCIIFFIPFFAYGGGETWSSNALDTNSLYELGTTVACAGVFAANLYVGINTRYWTFITVVTVLGSTLLVFIWIPIYSALADLPFNGVVGVLYTNFSFWAIVLITVFIAVAPRWMASAFRQSYFPRDKDIVREAWVGGTLKDELGISHRKDIKRAKKAKNQGISLNDDDDLENGPSLVKHLHQALGDSPEDTRGFYKRADISSPQKSPPILDGGSGASTPRSPFSYPPQALSPGLDPLVNLSPQNHTVPPPLLLRQSSDNVPTTHSPLSSTPATGVEYTSPSALETFQMTNQEIRRLSIASTDLKRASLVGAPANLRPGLGRSSSDRRQSWRPDGEHGDHRRRSLGGLLGITPEKEERKGGSPKLDFSESTNWEEEAAKRRSVLEQGWGQSYAPPLRAAGRGDRGYAV